MDSSLKSHSNAESMEKNFLNLQPIGYITSRLSESDMSQCDGKIVLAKDYRDTYRHALKKLKDFSYFWILFPCMDSIANKLSEKVSDLERKKLANGVFTTKFSHRICPVDLNLAKIVRIEDCTIYYKGCDIKEKEIPIFDIIPYIADYHNPEKYFQDDNENVVYEPENDVRQVKVTVDKQELEKHLHTNPKNYERPRKNIVGILKNSSESYKYKIKKTEDSSKVNFRKCVENGNCYATNGLKEEKKTQDDVVLKKENIIKPSKIYTCQKCFRTFSNKRIFKVHKKKHMVKCGICNQMFNKRSELFSHIKAHDIPKYHKCQFCHESFVTKSTLLTHLRKHEVVKELPEEEMNYSSYLQCKICFKYFKFEKNYLYHMKSHVSKVKRDDKRYINQCSHECGICGKMYKDVSSLTVHMKSHTDDQLYKCDYCYEQFSHKPDMIFHIATHDKDREKVFYSKSSYICAHPGCYESFTSSFDLSVHLETHKLKTVHECNKCKMSFVRKCSLDAHLRTGHILTEV